MLLFLHFSFFICSAQCGRSTYQDSRIISGTQAKKDMWPWQVSIYYNRQFICGGSIVSPQWIITAAHCVDGFDYTKYEVVLGKVSFFLLLN